MNKEGVKEVRFDDIDELTSMISDSFGEWGPELTITQDIIEEFADLTGDRQWIHVDVERARSGPFGGTIAHGLLTLAIAPRVRPPATFQIVGHGATLNYGSDRLRFVEPVRAGDAIHSKSRVADVQSHPRGTRITLEIAIHVVGKDRPSLSFYAVTLHTPPKG